MELPKEIGKDPVVVIDSVPYPVRYGARSLAIFSDMTGRLVTNISAPMTITEMYQQYYSGISAGCLRNKIPALTYDEFMTALDNDESIINRLVEIKTEQDSGGKK
jgi:hypothetical protein